jgi:DNA-binding SARP family transcriptional activator/tetratricopeptide (TPR) repeat protein/nucleoside-triphosphatase THEP1
MGASNLHILLLGPLEVRKGDEPVGLPPSKKARALLAYLVASERPQARSALCDMFWQDVHDPRAGLRWALSKLRAVLDAGDNGPIATAGDRVGFDAGSVRVDLLEVRAQVPGDPGEASTEALREAARTFRGDFVEGLDLPRCHRYEAWCLGVREHLRRLHLSVHATLVERLREEPEVAISHAYTRLTLDPYSEEAYLAAMELLAETGRSDKALELYERCRRMLRRRLKSSPSEALETARRRLMSRPRGVEEKRAEGGLAGKARADVLARALKGMPDPEHLPRPGEGEPPLVGRSEELESLMGVLERSASGGRGGAVLVTGEPGIGKTRLLREAVGRLGTSGGWVLSGPIFESEEVRPYGPWVDLLRQVPSAALDEEVRRSLRGLLEEPGRAVRSDRPTQRTQLFEAAARILRRVLGARAPGLIVLDDVQWLDSSSTALLHYLARSLGESPLVFALAARDREIRGGSAVARMLRSLEDAGRLERIGLRPLDATDTKALVQAVDMALDPTAVFSTSEGNPFFTLAVATSLREGVSRTPSNVRDELHDRLARLEPGARSLLPWAAALGRAFDLSTLVRVVGRPAAEVVNAMDELERRGIIRAAGTDRLDFAHSLLRQAAYDRPSEPVRRQIHRSIASALDQAEAGEGRMPGAVAHHAELGGLPAVAAAAYAEAAEHSLWVFAFDEAALMVERGLAQVGELSGEARLSLEMDLLRIYTFRSMQDRRPDDVEERVRAITEAAAVGALTGVVARGHACLMELQYQRGAYDRAEESSLLYAEAGRESGPATAARALSETAACLLLLDQAPDDARRLTEEASRVAEEEGLVVEGVALARALLHHHQGQLPEASRAFQKVIELCRRAQDRWWEAPAMTRRIMVALDRGDPREAREQALEAGELAERMNDGTEAAFARGLGAVAIAALHAEGEGEDRASEGWPEVEEALRELRELDSLWKIAQIQSYAVHEELRRGRANTAGERAEEALEAARALKRPSLLALSRALLARCSVLAGEMEEAERHLSSPEVARPDHGLSARARREIAQARHEIDRARQEIDRAREVPAGNSNGGHIADSNGGPSS